MQSKGLVTLVAVTVLVAAGAVAVVANAPRSRSDAHVGEPVLSGLASKIGDVAAIKITGEGGVTLTLEGSGEAAVWHVAERGGYPANKSKIVPVLLGFSELKLVEPKTKEPKLYDRLDVEEPGKDGGHARLVELDDAAGKKLGELIVGKRRPDRLGSGTDGLYIRHPADAQSWLAQGSVDLPTDSADWLDHKLVSIDNSRIQKVTLTHADGSRLVIKRDKEGDKFAVDGAPADAKFKSDTAAEQPVPSEGVAHAEWVTFDGLTVTGDAFDKDGKSWLRLAARGTDKAATEAADIAAKTQNWTFSVLAYKTKAMQTKLADLVEPAKGS
jgi:predicted Rdx family selenoprotein